MSLEWFEFHPKSFLTDTMRLNTEAKGAYLLLLLDYYEKEGPAPDDDDVLAAIAGLPLDVWQRHRKVIQPLFNVDGGLWHHATCANVIADAKARMARQSEAGKTAARKRWNKDADRNADRSAIGNTNRMRVAVRPASETDTDRNATVGGDFGPSVTAPSHNDAVGSTTVPNNADRMPIASETQSDPHAERNASGMHTSHITGIREGANAPSPAPEVFIGSLLHPDFRPASEVISAAINVDGIPSVELAGWIDEWKARCDEAGTRVVDWHAAWAREYDRRMKERAKSKPKPRVSVSKRVRLTKIPDNWEPNERHHELADDRKLDIALCVESFADHITNKRPDWSDADAAFRNWLKSPHRTEFKRGQAPTSQRRAPAPGGGSILDAFDRLDATLAGAGGAATQDQPHGQALVHRVPEE